MPSRIYSLFIILFFSTNGYAQLVKKELAIKRTSAKIKIDGELSDPAWKNAALANNFVENKPTPFKQEDAANATEIYFLYNDLGIYVGGYCHENTKDSIAKELNGRDGFGNNDFVGIIFDTYYDKLNGFEYFVTPLGEQWDAKSSYGGNEDFAWNAVWESASKIKKDGWTFEMFLPYAAIRFGKKPEQDWGLNIVRQRQKIGQKLFWQPIDPNVNGFLSQEGLLKDLENITPPLRLQFSPYFSTYVNHDGETKKTTTQVNGGMDLKYGINQAFTLDMTLIPDFGQVVSDNRILNLSPFEQKFSENRSFFTEGTELFNKGNLFYSRRIGNSLPIKFGAAYDGLLANEIVTKNPASSKLINATKISGRTQKGLGVGILNAITKPQYATITDTLTGTHREFETDPLTNYNIFVVDQNLKNNSSVSFVNASTIRSGKDYDANVSSGIFSINNKANTWNVGGVLSVSNIFGRGGKNTTGYSHNLNFGKTSGRLTFTVYQDLFDDKYDKNDLSYLTNNNFIENGFWVGYNWTKPKNWYNNIYINYNAWYTTLFSPLDKIKGRDRMYQSTGGNFNFNSQTKKLWDLGVNLNWGAKYYDFYEARVQGRTFANKGRVGMTAFWNSNSSKKLSWGGSFAIGTGSVFQRTTREMGLFGKIRFNSKFSIDGNTYFSIIRNQPGWADILAAATGQEDTVIFSRRSINSVENVLNAKYYFNNKMGITLRVRHYWSKVDPKQFYVLNTNGYLEDPTFSYNKNRNQNYNYFTTDLVYTWQIAPGSFVNLVWKDINETFTDSFHKNYFSNFDKIITGPQFNSFSVRVIYFLDYLTIKNRHKKA